jgi:uncharacterized protein YndB with AHSA1/START domain
MIKENYDWSQFTQRVAVAAPVDKVFRMWTDPKQLSSWFVSEAKMDLKKGGEYEWTWFGGSKEEGKILGVKKPNKIIFTFAHSICEVEVKKDKRGSLVILRQYDIPTGDEEKVNIHLNCSCGWTFYLTNLKTYLEFGIDLRENENDMINSGSLIC